MELNKNGVTVHVDDAVILSMLAERLAGEPKATIKPAGKAPRIGQPWPGQGGIYAGVMRGRDGGPDYHLIVGPYLDELDWDKAMAKVADLRHEGHKDYTLPYRAEQALQYANVPELFEKDYYWSCEQHAENGDYAWFQLFGFGNQTYWYKSDFYRARAVRRLVI